VSVVLETPPTLTSVGKVIEISCESPTSFQDAITRGTAKASETIHDIKGAWVEGQQVKIKDGKVIAYRVDLKITFVLD
jgi:flavin-binding protein dodecin